jgi:hypothetical protein
VKRHELLQGIAIAARAQGVEWSLFRQGANHEIWRCGTAKVPIPRHPEIGDRLAQRIFKELQVELGKDWWRD